MNSFADMQKRVQALEEKLERIEVYLAMPSTPDASVRRKTPPPLPQEVSEPPRVTAPIAPERSLSGKARILGALTLISGVVVAAQAFMPASPLVLAAAIFGASAAYFVFRRPKPIVSIFDPV